MRNYWLTITFILASAAFSVIKAQAEAQQAPLFFEYDLKGPAAVESKPLNTAGTIKSISCSWEFEGKVTLEVSANSGRAYTKIINGQVLEGGFVPGNELRFKAAIAENSALKKVTLGYADSSGVSRMPLNAQLADFKYRKEIRVSGGSDELFNYPLAVRIDKKDFEGNVEKDYRDVRFAGPDGLSPLNYYFEGEQKAQGALYADFWVKVPQLPKEGIILYLYYGNEKAASASDPQKVFAFFDDFNGPALDESKWQENLGLKKECEVKGGYLKLRDATLLSRNFKMKEGVLEFKARPEQSGAIQALLQQPQDKAGAEFAFKEVFYSSAYPGAEHTIAVNDVAKLNVGSPIEPGREYIYKITINSSSILFERYSADYQKQAQIQFMDTGSLSDKYIGLKADSSFAGNDEIYFDWVRVRPYAASEPQAGII